MEATYNEVTLEKLRFGLEHVLTNEVLDPLVEVIRDSFIDSIRVRIRAYMWSENVTTRTVRYPADWWEAFKG